MKGTGFLFVFANRKENRTATYHPSDKKAVITTPRNYFLFNEMSL